MKLNDYSLSSLVCSLGVHVFNFVIIANFPSQIVLFEYFYLQEDGHG